MTMMPHFKDAKISAVRPHYSPASHRVNHVALLAVLLVSMLAVPVHVFLDWPPRRVAPFPAAVSTSTLPLRCAIFNEWDFHYEVMTGLAAAFQAAGCEVDVFLSKDPDNITESMQPWLKGLVLYTDSFVRHPATYSVIALTTFPSMKFEKYIFKATASPSFSQFRQAYVAVVHNPDVLGEHTERLHLMKALGSRLWLATLSPAVSAYTDSLLLRKGAALGRKTEYIVPATPLSPALDAAVEKLSSGEAQPSNLCIQGIVDSSRRNYTEVFNVLEAVESRLVQQNERLLILGLSPKGDSKLELPPSLEAVVKRLGRLPYKEYDAVLASCRALFTTFASGTYLVKKASSTVATAVNLGVPLITDSRTLETYAYLSPQAVYVYPPPGSQAHVQGYEAAVAAALDAGQAQRRKAILRVKAQVMEHNEAVARAVLEGVRGQP